MISRHAIVVSFLCTLTAASRCSSAGDAVVSFFTGPTPRRYCVHMPQTRSKKPRTRPDRLEGQFLIAMPSMQDPTFARSLVYLCAHSSDGAMGLIINRYAIDITFAGLLGQLDLGIDETGDAADTASRMTDRPIHVGGPVEVNRGFVLHTDEYASDDTTLKVRNGVCLTATVDVLRAIVEGRGPRQTLVALGYAGWSPGQLEAEIQANGWLHVEADNELIFETPAEAKYDQALAKLGIDPARLSGQAGHA
jgi:putative transcriptional regulator